jgi:hypothetical protein
MSEIIDRWEHQLWLLPAGEMKPSSYPLPIFDFALMLAERFKKELPATRAWVESILMTPEEGTQ